MAVIGKAHNTYAVDDSTEITDGNIGFMVDVTGVLKCKLASDSTAVALPVIAGVFYPFSLKLAMDTGTTDVTNVYTIIGSGN